MSSNTDRPIQVGERVWGHELGSGIEVRGYYAGVAGWNDRLHLIDPFIGCHERSRWVCVEVHRLEQPQEPSIPVSVVEKMVMEIGEKRDFGFPYGPWVKWVHIRSIAREHLSKYGVTF